MELHKRYRWQNPDNCRYYEAWASTNLFGDWEIVRIWGKRRSALGRLVVKPVLSPEAAYTELLYIADTRLRRGYVRC